MSGHSYQNWQAALLAEEKDIVRKELKETKLKNEDLIERKKEEQSLNRGRNDELQTQIDQLSRACSEINNSLNGRLGNGAA